MKIVRFDSVGGASGDMILAALVDLGADLDQVRAAVSSLGVEEFSIEPEAVESHGLHGTRLAVHAHDHDAHHHHGDHHHHHHHHVHRKLSDVLHLLEHAELPASVKDAAARVFDLLAEAEGRVHGKDKHDVHFHEVAAMDSIIDIVGSCFALHLLGADRVVCGPLPLGTGTVHCAHGTMPVPVPAVVELLKGVPVVQTSEEGEMVTPTGAALLTAWHDESGVPSSAVMLAQGQGFGRRSFPQRPNMLRAVLLETREEGSPTDCLVLECDLDDMTPELVGDLSRRLLDQGALDVVLLPVQMKKNRPGTRISVLTDPARADALKDLVFRGSTTFGIRQYAVARTVLDRRFVEVPTRFGTVRVKVGTWQGDDVTCAPEMEDCIRVADHHGVAVREVYEEAVRKARG